MGANTRGVAGVGTGDMAQEVGAMLSALVVGRRRVANVGAALNGAPNPCSEPRAANVRRGAQREGGSPNYEGPVSLDFCDMKDGVSVEEVNAWHVCAMAENVAFAARLKGERQPRPVILLSKRETIKEGPLNVEQSTLDPDDPESVERTLQAIYGYVPALREFTEGLEAHLAIIRCAPRPVYGARRRHMQLHT
jgi:hypothetical protein